MVSGGEQGESYNEMVQDPEEKQLVEGPPHIFIFGAYLQSMMTRGAALGARSHDSLKAFLENYTTMSTTDKAEVERVFRVDKTYQSTKKKITMHIEKSGVRTEFISAMLQIEGVEHTVGRVPPTNLERELQDWVESFISNKGE